MEYTWAGFELTMLVVIGIDCIGCCRSEHFGHLKDLEISKYKRESDVTHKIDFDFFTCANIFGHILCTYVNSELSFYFC